MRAIADATMEAAEEGYALAVKAVSEASKMANQVEKWLDNVMEAQKPDFSNNGEQYDNSGVSGVWKKVHRDIQSTEYRKAISKKWESQEERSAQEGRNPEVTAGKVVKASRIPVRIGNPPRHTKRKYL